MKICMHYRVNILAALRNWLKESMNESKENKFVWIVCEKESVCKDLNYIKWNETARVRRP